MPDPNAPPASEQQLQSAAQALHSAAGLLTGAGAGGAGGGAAEPAESVAGSVDVQEQLLVQDLLYAMVGIEGKWIYLSPPSGDEKGAGAAASRLFQINPLITGHQPLAKPCVSVLPSSYPFVVCC